MAKHVLDRPYRVVERAALVPHDRYGAPRLEAAKRFSGLWELRWHASKQRPVSIGSGRLRLDGGGLVGEIVRGNDGQPALPGSSLKGAMRQVLEFLTPSCEQGGRDACRARPTDERVSLCPACSLFGAPGYGGRLAVLEARPGGSEPATAGPRAAAIPWPPNASGPPSTLRVYDRERAQASTREGRAAGPAPEPERHDAASGTFEGRLRFVNASRVELALLLLATGVAATLAPSAGESPRAGLRVGGKKFHGWGEVTTELVTVRLLHPERAVHEGSERALGWWFPLYEEHVLKGDPRRLKAWLSLVDAWSASP